ncbi:MAG TPA: 3'-5' exonuclease [Patescibacteria group bacterium]|nr:3'-5' exonuclease [Patescibacteria group bacterium]
MAGNGERSVVLPALDKVGAYGIGADYGDEGDYAAAVLVQRVKDGLMVVDQVTGTEGEVEVKVNEWAKTHSLAVVRDALNQPLPPLIDRPPASSREPAPATAPVLFDAFTVVVDTETTGFPGQDWARVVELGAVLLDFYGHEVACMSTLVRPDILDERADQALAVNGITRAMLEHAPPESGAKVLFESLLRRAAGPIIVTAFSVAFDAPMMVRTGIRCSSTDPAYIAAHGTALWWSWGHCIMLAAHDHMRARSVTIADRKGRAKNSVSLAAACTHFGVEQGQAHRALDDARAAARVLVEMRRREMAGVPVADAATAPTAPANATLDTLDMDAIDYTGA